MALERERGISITSTVLQFPYRGYTINLLDTPGHQDFGEDTYRTLLAADSAVMLIDAAKGVEPQTKKLFAICRERGIPLFTFMNKLDRPEPRSARAARRARERARHRRLSDELAAWQRRGLSRASTIAARTWCTSSNAPRTERRALPSPLPTSPIRTLRELVSEPVYAQFRDGIELLDGAGERFDREAMLRGETTPVFFGSAVTNFGVQLFLDEFVEMAPAPTSRAGVDPCAPAFTGFVFKIQANMDPRHRDRDRVRARLLGRVRARHDRAQRAHRRRHRGSRARCGSSPTIANRSTRHTPATSWASPTPAPSRSATRSTKERPSRFHRSRRSHRNILPRSGVSTYRVTKSFGKGISQLREEGAVQVFYPWGTPRTEPILGVVGELQFEVAKYRLESEYNVKTRAHVSALFAGAARRGRARRHCARATAVECEARRGLGRPAGRALRERVERAACAGVESAADVRARSPRRSTRRPLAS